MQSLDQPPPRPDGRVRLLPHLTVLRRDDLEIQLGVDSADALVLADPDGLLTSVLEVMDGRYRLVELTAFAAELGLAPATWGALLSALTGAGLLASTDDAGAMATEIRLIGLGPAGTRLAGHLLRSGVDRLIVVDPDAESGRHRWAAGRDRVQVVDHWSKPVPAEVELTVVVASSWEVDRAVSAALTRADHPHLLIRPRARGAVVGPLVIPGRTGCLGCTDLARTRADPAWPRMLAQLCRTRAEWDPLAADWAAALAATQVLGHLAGRTVETAAATLELGPVDWSWQRRVWPADPACGCCWSPRAQW